MGSSQVHLLVVEDNRNLTANLFDYFEARGHVLDAALWLTHIGGAAAGGLLVATWLPSMLDSTMSPAYSPGLYGSLVFIALNLHHYAIDAAIWRHDGPHLARISKGPQPTTAVEPSTAKPVAAPA